jgi:hypothetical protein
VLHHTCYLCFRHVSPAATTSSSSWGSDRDKHHRDDPVVSCLDGSTSDSRHSDRALGDSHTNSYGSRVTGSVHRSSSHYWGSHRDSWADPDHFTYRFTFWGVQQAPQLSHSRVQPLVLMMMRLSLWFHTALLWPARLLLLLQPTLRFLALDDKGGEREYVDSRGACERDSALLCATFSCIMFTLSPCIVLYVCLWNTMWHVVVLCLSSLSCH